MVFNFFYVEFIFFLLFFYIKWNILELILIVYVFDVELFVFE